MIFRHYALLGPISFLTRIITSARITLLPIVFYFTFEDYKLGNQGKVEKMFYLKVQINILYASMHLIYLQRDFKLFF